jgi:hypothetical protein
VAVPSAVVSDIEDTPTSPSVGDATGVVSVPVGADAFEEDPTDTRVSVD